MKILTTKCDITMYKCEPDYFKWVKYFFHKYVIEIYVIFLDQASVIWNVGSELWKSNYRKWNSIVSFVKLIVWTCVIIFWKEWNMLFEKCAI